LVLRVDLPEWIALLVVALGGLAVLLLVRLHLQRLQHRRGQFRIGQVAGVFHVADDGRLAALDALLRAAFRRSVVILLATIRPSGASRRRGLGVAATGQG